ncbi:MAG: A/G-specific adenine glycosylase [Gemmatimonadetes bacterium]|nr:MAG: A/G-specific adenine glycosylase [Gemmatimonadota bacterium]
MDILQFQTDLHQWYAHEQRQLPWRETTDPYKIWVSEVMLQQTQVATILRYYPSFLERFPTVEALAQADLTDLLKQWEGMGYYARARNLHKAAKIVVTQYGGHVPADYATFRTLPGVGDYIAAAVQSIAFNQPYAVVDGNVKRVLARLLTLEALANDSQHKVHFQREADRLLDPHRPGNHNQALMELGALVCRPQTPQCLICPVRAHCAAAQSARQMEFPKRKPLRRTPTYHIAVGVVQKADKILITQRKPDGLLGGLWEFPGGKVKKGETAEAACRREIQEETELIVDVQHHLATVKHAYSHFRIKLDVFLCTYRSGEVTLHSPVDFRWVTLDQITDFPFPTANRKFIPQLVAHLTSLTVQSGQ